MAGAGLPEIDSSGQLFAPKSVMMRGGSDETRGIALENRPYSGLAAGLTLQTVYDTRFITYLSRFLLTFDPAARSWWTRQGLDDSWETTTSVTDQSEQDRYKQQQVRFAAFAESVEVGLADYFVGPYGSYASVQAAKAGLSASRQQVSAGSNRPNDPKDDKSVSSPNILERLFFGQRLKNEQRANALTTAKQGVLNLFALLKARYVSTAAKRQLVILFSLVSSPDLQPTQEITSLLGEADNATITRVSLQRPVRAVENESTSRTSSRRGGGYSINAPPKVQVEAPPALGGDYVRAKTEGVLRPTGRILRINVIDGGEGYTSAPSVTITQGNVQRPAKACSITDRKGRIESIVVLDPGFGYGGRLGNVPPLVTIEPPQQKSKKGKATTTTTLGKTRRRARVEAELEYELAGVRILNGGNGYSASNPPSINVEAPEEDPDWYLPERNTQQGQWGYAEEAVIEPVAASVSLFRLSDRTVVSNNKKWGLLDFGTLERVRREPLELLPSSVRPELRVVEGRKEVYRIPMLPAPGTTPVPSARFRAFDPVFGGVGSSPVTKGALSLSASEYTRLALSGAICTVLVRNLLNPLELVKTKIQLKNDVELNNFVASRAASNNRQKESTLRPPSQALARPRSGRRRPPPRDGDLQSQSVGMAVAIAPPQKEEETAVVGVDPKDLGALDMIRGLVELRGFGSLFQSADITFLASLVFGSFGFGATELFRRSFSLAFFSEGSEQGEELILLAAAALACVVTAAAASPFEVLRVKSMGLVESASWKDVLTKFLVSILFVCVCLGSRERDRSCTFSHCCQNETKGGESGRNNDDNESFGSFELQDLLPLWGGFAPTVARELPFAVVKFLTFDVIAKLLTGLVNSNLLDEGALPVQVGVGTTGLVVSAVSGAVAGIAGAIVSHPADLILTLTSSSSSSSSSDWRDIVANLLKQDGGVANLFIGLPARCIFFFLVIGLQFFLYDYVKNIFQVGSDDLSLVLDVFYAVRQGLVDAATTSAI